MTSDPGKDIIAAVASATVGAMVLLIAPLALLAILIGGSIFALYKAYALYQSSPAALERKAREHTHRLYLDARARAQPAMDKVAFGKGVARRLRLSAPDAVIDAALEAALDLYDVEVWGGAVPEPPAVCNSIEGARYRDHLAKVSAFSEHHIKIIQSTIAESLNAVLDGLPPIEDGDSFLTVPAQSLLPGLNRVVESMILPYFGGEARPFFETLRERLDRNLQSVKGVMPAEYQGDSPVFAYLRDTPLHDVLGAPVPLGIPRHTRWEHAVITGGSGHGKTTLLETLILRDIKDPLMPALVVIDSQRQLIGKLSRLAATQERNLIIIDPKDGPALNVFAVNTSRLDRYSDVERERVRNHTLEIFTYLFDSLLGADLTVRQGALFNYLVMAMLAMPQAMGRVATLRDIIAFTENPGAYAPAIDALEPIAKEFFRSDFMKPQYAQTKEQIRYRLHAILGNPTLARLFLAPVNSVDLFSELNAGAIILIDTDKGFLGAKNSGYLGRIAITLLLQAILERDASKSPQCEVFMYVDEAGEYFDRSIDKFLTEARKQRAGIILAHQYLSQMQPELRASVAANTAIKFAGGLSTQDARVLASDMRTTPEFLLAQERLNFACHVRNVTRTATSLPVRTGTLEREPQVSEAHYAAFRARNKARLAAPDMTERAREPEPEPASAQSEKKSDNTKPAEW